MCLNLAVAMVAMAERLSIDEPTSPMDKRLATNIFAEIISYHFHIGKCPIFVTNTIRNGAVIDNTSAKYGGNLLLFDNIIDLPVSSLTPRNNLLFFVSHVQVQNCVQWHTL